MFYLSQDLKLTKSLKNVLHEQTIDEHGPGTIVEDFERLLDFVGEKGVLVTGTHVLPLKLLKPINERLSQPILLGLKRPQQKSYPHINGLYLLLRVTGLSQIETKKKKPQLVIDHDVLRSWAGLNPTEKYMTLLESWTIRGQDEVIGERGGRFWSDSPIGHWAHFFDQIPDKGRPITGDSEAERSLRFWPKLHNLGLLELFGLIRVQHGAVIEGEGWQIERIWRTPLGDAILALLINYMKANFEEIFEYDDPSEIPFGTLQPAMKPYFPEWEHNLTFPTIEFRAGVFVFKASLAGKLWRRIAIPATLVLTDLATSIIKAYGFDFDHLYMFEFKNRFGGSKKVMHPYMDEGPFTDEVRIGDVPLEPGLAMTFVYDFGDWWRFEVTLERIDPPDPALTQPKVLEKLGRSPRQYG